MKTLAFTVNGQKLSKKPSILFSRLVAAHQTSTMSLLSLVLSGTIFLES